MSALDRIAKLISESKSIAIFSHKDSDGDSLGSMIALKRSLSQMGKEVFAFAPAEFPARYMFLLKYADNLGYASQKLDIAIALDCSTPERIAWSGFELPGDVPLINIDHHEGNMDFGNLNWVEPSASAVGEMVFAILEKISAPIDNETASALYVAIITDTGRFSFGNTTAKSLEAASKLCALGANPKFLNSEVYFNFSEEYLRNIGIALFNSRSYHNGRILFLTLDRATTRNFVTLPVDSEGIIDLAMTVKNVDIAALFKEFALDEVHVSIRSRRGIDIGKIAEYYGGGGHPNAAGCIIHGTLTTAQQGVLNQIRKLLGYV